jgi:general secretion pathway protein H
VAKAPTPTLARGCKGRNRIVDNTRNSSLAMSTNALAGHRTSGSERAAGFTLIEILLVVLIVGIALGLVSVNLGVLDRRSTADEVERLARVLQFASERAAVRGTPLEVEFLPGSYRFSTIDVTGKRQLLFAPRELAERTWLAGIEFRKLVIDEQVTAAGNHKLVFSAESPPFELEVMTPDGLRRIKGNSAGEVMLADDPLKASS